MNFRKIISSVAFVVTLFIAGSLLISCQEEDSLEVTDILFSNISTGKKILTVGDEFTIKYVVIPEALQESAEIVWETSDKNVAKVRKGKITAEGPGEAIITASCGNVKTSVLIKVDAIQIESLDFPQDIEVYLGTSVKVDFTNILPVGGSLTTIEWEIEVYGEAYGDAEFEIVDGELYITGTRLGIAGLVGKIGDKVIGLCEIIVKENVPVESLAVSLSKNKVTFGESLTVSTTIKPANASLTDVVISCVPADVVTIEGDKITAKQTAGKVTVFAYVGDVSGSAEFEILPPPLELSISHDMTDNKYCFLSPDKSVGNFPESVQLTLKANYNDIDLSKAVWKSSAPSVIEVDNNGLVRGVGHGYALVTAELEGVTVALDMRSVMMSSFSIQAYDYYNKSEKVTSIETPENKSLLEFYDPAFSLDPNSYAFESIRKFYKITASPNGAFTVSEESGTFVIRASSATSGSVIFSLNNGKILTIPVVMQVRSLTFIGRDTGKVYGTVQNGGSLTIVRTDSNPREGVGYFETINVYCNSGAIYDSELSEQAYIYSWSSSTLNYDPFGLGSLDQRISGTHKIKLTEFDPSFSVTITVNKKNNP